YYMELSCNDIGIDPYTRSSPDIYQDLFDEGSFMGKGIYDVACFNEVLSGCFADNRVLSHDLLEGCYLRAGLISDVPVYEKAPHHYLADMSRRKRWIRGDWQLIPWFFPKVKDQQNRYQKNPLSCLAKFKLFDNLRRSLYPIATWVLLIVLMLTLPLPWYW